MNGFDRVSLEARLKQGLRQMGLEVSELKQAQLLEYLALIHKWNKVHNLTAVREPADMVVLHLLDSLAVLPYVGNSGRLIDVGSGAGLPGIPLAIRSEEHTSELQSRPHLVCRLLLEKKK